MKERDRGFWDGLRLPGIAPEAAREMLEAIFRAQPIAIRGHDGVSINLRLKAENDADHILYKVGERRRRANKFTRDPSAYKVARAERIGFLLPTLENPDEIRAEEKHPQARFYISHISSDETFMVIVERPSRHMTYFTTAFEVNLNDTEHRRKWHRRMNGSKPLYIRKK